MKILNIDRQFNVDMAHREEVLTKLAKQLEKLFGRGKPSIYEYREYERNKEVIIERVKNLKHFNEEGLSGSDQILLQKNKEEHFDDVSSDDSEDEERLNKYIEMRKREKDMSKNKYIIERGPTQKKPIPHNPQPSTSKFMSHRELMAQSEIKFKDAYTFEKFKSLLQIETQRIEVKYKDFEKNPEKHPHYSEEWKSFWQRRYNELLALGKDANGHNYKPEWVEFWMPRMKQIKLKEIEDKKKEIQKKLDITPEAAKKYEEGIAKKRTRSRSMSYSPSPDRKSRSPVVLSDDSDDDEDFHRKRRDETKRARRDSSDSSRSSNSSDTSSSSSEVTDESPLNVVTVLKLLMELPGVKLHLLISPEDIERKLLEAKRLEIGQEGSSIILLQNFSYLKHFRDIQEGLENLQNDLLPRSQVIPVKRCINHIKNLLDAFEEKHGSLFDELMTNILSSLADNPRSALTKHSKALKEKLSILSKYEDKLRLLIHDLLFVELTNEVTEAYRVDFDKLMELVANSGKEFKLWNRLDNDHIHNNQLQGNPYYDRTQSGSEIDGFIPFFRGLTLITELDDLYKEILYELLSIAMQLESEEINSSVELLREPSNIVLLRRVRRELIFLFQKHIFSQASEELVKDLILNIDKLFENLAMIEEEQ